jgi:hypothetical protein
MNSNLYSSIDHLVIVSPSLDAGVKYVYENLGVMPDAGGVHTKMGTHNYLLNLGNSTYLEVIAINHDCPKPGRPRWFALDSLDSNAKPGLLTWVARTNNINLATANSQLEFGNIEPMIRSDLNWLITIPPDGSLPCHGIAPSLIQWLSETPSFSKLPDSGCSLICIEGFHQKNEIINETLQSIGFNGNFSAKKIEPSCKPYLIAYIQTPNGTIKLKSQYHEQLFKESER